MSIRPYKFVGQLIAQKLDDDGNVTGEAVVGEVGLFSHQFGDLQTMIDEAWPAIEAEHEPSTANKEE